MTESDSNETLTLRYHFHPIPDGQDKVVTVQLDRKTLKLKQAKKGISPSWTALDHCKCPNCPYEQSTTPECPAALSVVDFIEAFGQAVSFERVKVRIETEERDYAKETSIQEALSSLLGIYMVTSGCPVIGKLRPMVRTHLPFATLEETTYRVLSMYLLAQYMVSKKSKGDPDWQLSHLIKMYEEIATTNEHFFKRFRGLDLEDASANALTILHAFSSSIPFSIDEDLLGDLEQLFSPYLNE